MEKEQADIIIQLLRSINDRLACLTSLRSNVNFPNNHHKTRNSKAAESKKAVSELSEILTQKWQRKDRLRVERKS